MEARNVYSINETKTPEQLTLWDYSVVFARWRQQHNGRPHVGSFPSSPVWPAQLLKAGSAGCMFCFCFLFYVNFLTIPIRPIISKSTEPNLRQIFRVGRTMVVVV